MTALSVDKLILDPDRYAAVRSAHRAGAIETRRSRRLQVGPVVSLEFESGETLRYQAQEMLFVEHVTDARTAAAEIDVYARLLPTTTSVSATMLIQIADPDVVRAELVRLNGLHDHIALEVGETLTPARDVPPPDEGPSEHTHSVHFLRFEFTPAAHHALRLGETARIVVGHPGYEAYADLGIALQSALVADMDAAGID